MSRHRSTARRYSVLAVGLLVVVLFSGVAVADPVDLDPDTDLDGEGTETQPYNITNASELQSMRGNLTAHYELGETIDASNTSEWYGGDGLYPIGNSTGTFKQSFSGDPFEGSFDGNGFEIQNLTISRNDESYVGLFGYASSTSSIGNVTLFNVSVNGTAHVGALVGESHGAVYDTHVSGDVRPDHQNSGQTGEAPSNTGGGSRTGALVGMLTDSGTVSNATSSANITGVTGNEKRLGGLVGLSDGTIADSIASGDVHGNGGIGGLVGSNTGNLRNTSAAGDVSGEEDIDPAATLGGLVGVNSGTITESYATGNVSDDGTGSSIGGLIGSTSGTVTKSYANGTVDGTNNVGGLAGKNSDTVRDSYATGAVIGGTPVGGLVGDNDATIERSYAIVDVPDGEGGLVGDNTGTITAAYWDTEATGIVPPGDGEGLSTFEMTALVAKDYMDFDYHGVWNATDRYPRLAWENTDEPDPYPTAAPDDLEVWLLNDSDTGYYQNFSIDSSGDVRWLGDVVAAPGTGDSAQVIEIAAGNATQDYDTLVVGPGAYNLTNHQVNLTADTGADLTRVFSHNGSDETEILRASGASFASYEESVLRVDNPAAATLEIGDSETFDANGDGGFYIESDKDGNEDSPLVGVYETADAYELTVRNTTFGMWTNHGDNILLRDANTAFDLEVGLNSHSGAVINASAASSLSVRNSTITEEYDPRGNNLDGEGISFLKLEASGLDDVTIDNVTVDGATEATEVGGVVDITDLDTDASVTIDGLRIENTSQNATNIVTDVQSLSASNLNFTDIGKRGLTITGNVSSVIVADSELTNTSTSSIYADATFSQFNVTGTTITDSSTRGIYVLGTVGNATIENNTLNNSVQTPIEFEVNAGQSTPYEIVDNYVDGSGKDNSLVVVRQNARVNITDNTLLNSSFRGIYLDAADSVIQTNAIKNTSAGGQGIHLEDSANDVLIANNTVSDSAGRGIHIDGADHVTVLNATVDTAATYGIDFDSGALGGELTESTITNTGFDALRVDSNRVSVTELSLMSGTVSANMTNANLNTTTVPAGPGDYQSGADAVEITRNDNQVNNLTLSYNTSAFDIDPRALDLWLNNTDWSREDSTVNTDEQVVVVTDTIITTGVLSTFASNVSIAADDTTVDEDDAGTIDVTATNANGTGLENVELNITDDDGLDGISVDDTVTTDANGEASFGFRENNDGTYVVEIGWTNETTVTDTATVSVRRTGGGGGGGDDDGGNGDDGSDDDAEDDGPPVDLDPNEDLDGSGTEDDPFIITNASELQAVAGNLTADYRLGRTINATNTSEWHGAAGFKPIGNDTHPFVGSLDGYGFEIRNLTINRTTDDVGIFGYAGAPGLTGEAELRNVTLSDVDVSGGNIVGSLVGNSTAVRMLNVTVTGGSVEGSDSVGGLIGVLDTPGRRTNIIDSRIDLDTVTGTANVGGVVGSTRQDAARANILDSSAHVTVRGHNNVGGFMGRSDSVFISNVTTAGVVDASSTDDANAGGLIGRFGGGTDPRINIFDGISSATVSADGRNVGGLLGVAHDAVGSSSASGNVTGRSHVGGLVGTNRDRISSSFALGNVSGENSVGGLVGRANTSDGTAVSTAYASGTVRANGTSGDHYGGLVGYHEDGDLQDVYATGTVDGNNNTGGLIGSTNTTGTVTIKDTYAVGTVSGNSTTGGLLGYRNNTIVESSYWDENRTDQSASDGGTGLPTANMVGSEVEIRMTGFDFTTTWETVEEADPDATADGYPILGALDREPQLLFPTGSSDDDGGDDDGGDDDDGDDDGGDDDDGDDDGDDDDGDDDGGDDDDDGNNDGGDDGGNGDSTTDVSDGRNGDIIEVNDETTPDSSSINGLGNIAVDGLSVELTNDRDFWIDVETYERGEEGKLDASAESGIDAENGTGSEAANSAGQSITATFERETKTVSVGYVTVTHNLEPEDIANVTFNFSVRDAYLDDLDVDPENVSLYRQTDQWTSLPTDYRELSGGRYRFEANSPGFSSFAIGTNAPLSIVVNGSLDRTRIRDGETATALATVNNRGQNAVTHTVNLTADGEMVATETVSIDGGAVTEVPLAFEPVAGSYEMAVDDVSLGSLTVVAEESQPLWWLLVVAIPILLLVMWYRRQENDGGENNEDDEDDK